MESVAGIWAVISYGMGKVAGLRQREIMLQKQSAAGKEKLCCRSSPLQAKNPALPDSL